MTHLNKQQKRKELIKLLQEKAYRKGDFTLSSGRKSEHYVNCKPVTLNGWGLKLASSLMLDLIDEDAVAVGGLTLGADPLVSSMSVISAVDEVKLDALIVRKETKGHGTGAWIEGPELPKGSKITVVEDVITTGGSAIKAVTRLRDFGYKVDRVVAIVDRQENGEADEFMESVGLELHSIFKLDELT